MIAKYDVLIYNNMVYGDREELRSIYLNDDQSISTARLDALLAFGTRQAINQTGKDDWTSSDVQWEDIKDLTYLWAASNFWLTVSDPENKASEFRRSAEGLALRINRSKPANNATNPSYVMATSDYTTIGMNPNADYYLSDLNS